VRCIGIVDSYPAFDEFNPSIRSHVRQRQLILFSLAYTVKPALGSSACFWVIADAYKDAANAAFELTISRHYVGEIRVPCVFLYFRCIELVLKSVLIFHGIHERDITRTLGHRVSALLERAEAFPQFKTVGLSTEDRQLIREFSDVYSDKWFEYPEDSLAAYPDLATLKDLATRLCDRIRMYEEQTA
jgi:hypothetical protein